MERHVKGLALLLCAVLLAVFFLAVFFLAVDFRYFDLLFFEVPLPLLYLLVGAAGLAMVFLPGSTEK